MNERVMYTHTVLCVQYKISRSDSKKYRGFARIQIFRMGSSSSRVEQNKNTVRAQTKVKATRERCGWYSFQRAQVELPVYYMASSRPGRALSASFRVSGRRLIRTPLLRAHEFPVTLSALHWPTPMYCTVVLCNASKLCNCIVNNTSTAITIMHCSTKIFSA